MRLCFGVTLLSALALRALAGEPPAPPRKPDPMRTSCIACHSQLDGAALTPAQRAPEDIHFQRGLSCHDCHGGNPLAGEDGDVFAAHDEKKGFRGKPKRLDVPVFCARCHADAAFMKAFNPGLRVDQLSEYRTSVHGKRNALGDERVAVCTDCHGVHGIHPKSDPRSSVHPTHVADTCGRCHGNVELMRQYELPANQYAGYKSSVHARALYDQGDLSAPTCNDCHGSHGAAPPGVQTVANVCGSCHTREATLFREIEKKKGLNLLPCIQCVVCHDNHGVAPPNDDMLGVGPRSTCTSCHDPGSAAYRGAEEMGVAAGRLRDRLAQARGLLERAERAGVEVSADQVALRKGEDQLVEARVLAHSFDRDRFLKTTADGIAVADEGVAAAERAFAELRQRRLGLAVSLVVIAAVIAALVLKIGELEAKQDRP